MQMRLQSLPDVDKHLPQTRSLHGLANLVILKRDLQATARSRRVVVGVAGGIFSKYYPFLA